MPKFALGQTLVWSGDPVRVIALFIDPTGATAPMYQVVGVGFVLCPPAGSAWFFEHQLSDYRTHHTNVEAAEKELERYAAAYIRNKNVPIQLTYHTHTFPPYWRLTVPGVGRYQEVIEDPIRMLQTIKQDEARLVSRR